MNSPNQNFAFLDLHPPKDDTLSEVCASLGQNAKSLSPKFFYDEKGSQLFEAITELEEYYPTRTELALFDAHLPEIAKLIGHNSCVIEYGSGSSLKIRKLLEALLPSAYVPVDISRDYLLSTATALSRDFSELSVFPVCADFTQDMALPAQVSQLHRVGFFPGSSIGNFEPTQAREFIRQVGDTLGANGYFLVGVDCKKDPLVLERAYADAAGVTAAFNLNALVHLNRELGANFQLENFQHMARYNEQQGCIEMFLRSTRAQQVNIGDAVFDFEVAELLHTENSYKYAPSEFMALAESAGFRCLKHWLDKDEYFGLYLLQAK
jgi:dimethylhistidine N-methyltransferase